MIRLLGKIAVDMSIAEIHPVAEEEIRDISGQVFVFLFFTS